MTAYNSFYMLLDSVGYCSVEDFYIWIHKGYLSITYFSYDDFIWFWYPGNTGLIALDMKSSFLFYFSEGF